MKETKEVVMYMEINRLSRTEFIRENVRCMCVGPDCTFVAVSGSNETKIWFYDLAAAKQRKQEKVLQPSNAAAVKKLVHCADTPLAVIEGGQFVNYEMNLSPDGNLLSVGSFKKDIRLWTIRYRTAGKRETFEGRRFKSVEQLCTVSGAHKSPIASVAFSCDSKYMVSASHGGVVKAWDLDNAQRPELVLEQDLGIGKIESVVMSYQWDLMAVLNEERKRVFVYRLKYAKKKVKLHCTFERVLIDEDSAESRITVVKFSPDSLFVAVGTTDADVRVYKIPAAHKKSAK